MAASLTHEKPRSWTKAAKAKPKSHNEQTVAFLSDQITFSAVRLLLAQLLGLPILPMPPEARSSYTRLASRSRDLVSR